MKERERIESGEKGEKKVKKKRVSDKALRKESGRKSMTGAEGEGEEVKNGGCREERERERI